MELRTKQTGKSNKRHGNLIVFSRDKLPQDAIVIAERVYDLYGWFDRHPGGTTLLRDFIRRDATAVFFSTHRSRKAHDILGKMQPTGYVGKDDYTDYVYDDEFYSSIQFEVSKRFKELKINPNNHWLIVVWHAFLLSLNISSYIYFCSTGGFSSIVMFAVSFAIAQVNIMHSVNHGVTVRRRGWRLATFYLDLAGLSSWIWRFEHNGEHHQKTASEVDTEKQGPARLHDSQESNFISRYQSYLLPLFMPLFWPFSILYDPIAFAKYVIAGKVPCSEIIGYVLGKIGYIFLSFVIPINLFGWTDGLKSSAMFQCIGGLYVLLCLMANHTTDECDMYNKPQGRSWAKTQVTCSANIILDNCWLNLLLVLMTGGLSNQIEHHLFPAIAPIFLPLVAPIVKENCNKDGVPYNVTSSFVRYFSSFVKRLRDLENPNFNLSDTMMTVHRFG